MAKVVSKTRIRTLPCCGYVRQEPQHSDVGVGGRATTTRAPDLPVTLRQGSQTACGICRADLLSIHTSPGRLHTRKRFVQSSGLPWLWLRDATASRVAKSSLEARAGWARRRLAASSLQAVSASMCRSSSRSLRRRAAGKPQESLVVAAAEAGSEESEGGSGGA
eukprot:scaffold115626_cov32-Tisochrysis_lutea.AAC.1